MNLLTRPVHSRCFDSTANRATGTPHPTKASRATDHLELRRRPLVHTAERGIAAPWTISASGLADAQALKREKGESNKPG